MDKQFLTGVLLKTLNISEQEVASLFNEDGTLKNDAEQTILDWDAEKVRVLKAASAKITETDAYKKAQADVLTKFENDFKAKTGFKSDKKGIELVLEYTKSLPPQEGAITDDVIKKHPLFLTLQEEKETAIASAKAEGESALNSFKSEISKKEVFNKVSTKALELFHSQKPVLSKDPIKAKRQEELFLKELKSFEYEIQDDRIVILKEGKVLENKNGHAVRFDDLIKTTAGEYFDFHAAEVKRNAGNGGQGQGAGTGENTFKFEVPKDDREYANMMSDSSRTLEERTAIDAAYSQSKTT